MVGVTADVGGGKAVIVLLIEDDTSYIEDVLVGFAMAAPLRILGDGVNDLLAVYSLKSLQSLTSLQTE